MDNSAIQQLPPSQQDKHSHFESCFYGEKDQITFEDLSISVLSFILSKTTPQDVARLTVVNRQCEEATRSDQVWNTFLPANAKEVAENAHGGPLVYGSAKDLYHQLTNHVLVGDGTQGCWIDQKTGGLCWSLSGAALNIVWGGDTRYWTYVSKSGSRFPTVAKLKVVWWFDMAGDINIKLPPGEYTISWVFQLDRRGRGWNDTVTSIFAKNDAVEITMQMELSTSLRGWVYYNFGHFTVTSDLDDEEAWEEVNLKFSLHNHDCDFSKTGLWVDGIVIRSGKFDI